MNADDILCGYDQDAAGLIPRYENIDPEVLFGPVSDYVTGTFDRVLDVGSGSGRDAAWFARRARSVVAVEPVAAFRQAARHRHGAAAIMWLDDRLPYLEATLGLGQRFDLITVTAVWQHLGADDRATALRSLRRLIDDGARLVLSIRDGAGVPARPVYPANVAQTLAYADQAGFELDARANVPSVQAANQAAGVDWTWLVLRAREVARTP